MLEHERPRLRRFTPTASTTSPSSTGPEGDAPRAFVGGDDGGTHRLPALPRTTEGFVRVKFYIDRIVYLAISRDESTLGYAFPMEWREASSVVWAEWRDGRGSSGLYRR
jgi:hypothetical protein